MTKPWINIAYTLDAASTDALTGWIKTVGLRPQAAHKLHLTVAYSRSGLGDERVVALEGPVSFVAKPVRVDRFDVGDRSLDVPIVLVCDGDFVAHAERTRDALDEMGFEVVRHPDGYNPHITIAKIPAEEAASLSLPDAPDLELRIDGLVELHARKQ